MKIIQSFWSGNQKNVDTKYGWQDSKFHWMGWILSVNQLVKFYDDVELYTDDFGYDILINHLNLPYTKVHVVLNDLDSFPSELWALAKIKVYAMQDKPFVHVDGDVFIWDKFPLKLSTAALIAQNLEKTGEYYSFTWNNIKPHLCYIPEELVDFSTTSYNLSANMGLTGGSDILFYKKYAQNSFDFVQKNEKIWNEINLFNFNIFFEQVLFYKMTNLNSIKLECLFSEIWEDNLYPGFADFHKVPHLKKYLHLLGNFKRNLNVCKGLESYVIRFFPEYYSRLMSIYINEGFEPKGNLFLNTADVKLYCQAFEFEVKNNDFVELNFLLKRDLNNIHLNKLYYDCIKNKHDFKIVRLPGFKIIDYQTEATLEIDEYFSNLRLFELDNVDEIILDELSSPINYFELNKKMQFYLEDQKDNESILELESVVKSKLEIFILLKIISIYI